jgi:hypothetical protein
VNIFREAVTDSTGAVDVANLSLFLVMNAVLSTVFFICVMAYLSYIRCAPSPAQVVGVAPTQTIIPAVTCAFDPQPIGLAIGAVFAGFATALGALAAYMAATRPPRPQIVDRRRDGDVHVDTRPGT